MKNNFVLLMLLCMGYLVHAQDAPDYSMFETMYMTPKDGAGDALETGLKAHNDKFHAADGFRTAIWRVVNGPNSGKLLWVMGPTTWTAQDSRPTGKDHGADWDSKVGPHITDYGATEYWKFDPKVSYMPNDFDLKKMRIWVLDVKAFDGYRLTSFLEKIVETMEKSEELSTPFGVYWNDQANSAGRDVALIWFFDKWSWMDENVKFPMLYEKVHGPGTWMQAMDEWGDFIESIDEELRVYVPEMSSDGGRAIVTPADN